MATKQIYSPSKMGAKKPGSGSVNQAKPGDAKMGSLKMGGGK